MSDTVAQIKDRLSIVEVVSGYVKLERAGVNLKAKCPFHNEKTPSFMVSPARGTYHCFGCGAGGDIFSFIEAFEGTDFKGALKILSERAGVPLKPERKEVLDQRERLYTILESATKFFEETLSQVPDAKGYLSKRGIKNETVPKWRIGFAPDTWQALHDHLRSKGFAPQDIEAAGLIKPSEKGGSPYDRFRARIMFPILDGGNRVIGFSGRLLPSTSKMSDEAAKYINSPETLLFDKSRVLYGFHYAKIPIRKYNFSVLVEGQMDVVLSHQAGYSNTVASSGTALTREQLTQLSRLSSNLVMAFDADNAGVKAGERGIELALSQGLDVKVAALPSGKDPADLVLEGGDAWKKAVRSAKHVVEFFLDHVCDTQDDSRKRRLEVSRLVLPFVARISNKIDQAHFVSRVASRIEVPEEIVWEEVRKLKQEKRVTSGALDPHSSNEGLKVLSSASSREEAITSRLIAILWAQESLTAPTLDVRGIDKKLAELVGEQTLENNRAKLSSTREALLFEIEILYPEPGQLAKDVEELMAELARERMREDYAKALGRLRKAEQGGATKDIEKALSECRKLSAQIHGE